MMLLYEDANQPATGRVGMSAGEVIALLSRLDPATPVVVSGPVGGFSGVAVAGCIPLCLEVNRARDFGPHEVPGPGDHGDVVAVALLAEPLPEVAAAEQP
jgi:hypothetical protein